MFRKPFIINTSVLLADVLSFHDDSFYQMGRIIVGASEATLLTVQRSRSVNSFLNTENVFDIFTIQCSALNSIKRSICLEADDHTFMVKPGCRSKYSISVSASSLET